MATFIYVENQRHELASDEVTAEQVRQLGNIPADNKVYRETAGDEPDPEVSGGPVHVHEGEKFYAVPPGTFGGVATASEAEISALVVEYGGGARDAPDGQKWLVLDRFVLGPAWSPPVAPLAIRITGYPEAALDGFCIPASVHLASGAQPANTSLSAVLGSDLWLTFSYHPANWRPGRHSLRSYLKFVSLRFAEGR
jgi:Prokaryotic E2 family E